MPLKATITAEDLKAFHAKNYGVGSVVVVAVGDIDHKNLSNIIQKNFSDWKQSPIKENNETRPGKPKPGQNYITMKDKTSSDLVYGIPLILSNCTTFKTIHKDKKITTI